MILLTILRSQVGLPPSVHRYLWLWPRLQGPRGLQGLQGVTASITAPVSTITQIDFLRGGSAVPTFGPARTQGQGEPEASSFSGFHFIDCETEAQRVTISLCGTSVRILKMKKKSSTSSLRCFTLKRMKIFLTF